MKNIEFKNKINNHLSVIRVISNSGSDEALTGFPKTVKEAANFIEDIIGANKHTQSLRNCLSRFSIARNKQQGLRVVQDAVTELELLLERITTLGRKNIKLLAYQTRRTKEDKVSKVKDIYDLALQLNTKTKIKYTFTVLAFLFAIFWTGVQFGQSKLYIETIKPIISLATEPATKNNKTSVEVAPKKTTELTHKEITISPIKKPND